MSAVWSQIIWQLDQETFSIVNIIADPFAYFLCVAGHREGHHSGDEVIWCRCHLWDFQLLSSLWVSNIQIIWKYVSEILSLNSVSLLVCACNIYCWSATVRSGYAKKKHRYFVLVNNLICNIIQHPCLCYYPHESLFCGSSFLSLLNVISYSIRLSKERGGQPLYRLLGQLKYCYLWFMAIYI